MSAPTLSHLKRENQPAFPFEEIYERFANLPSGWINHKGISKREFIATMAMQKLLNEVISLNRIPLNMQEDHIDVAVKLSVYAADRLIDELNKTEK
jgi:hypothetical protein